MSSGFERLRSRYIRRAAAAIDMGHSKALKNVWELKLSRARMRDRVTVIGDRIMNRQK
jgi:hypothetical protein